MHRWRGLLESKFLVVIAACSAMATTTYAQELAITHVQPNMTHATRTEENVRVRFTLTAPAQVALQIFDGRDILIREISSSKQWMKGEHTLSWDLRDSLGRTVPPEAYTYTLEARGGDGSTVRYDLADVTGAETITARDVKWDAQSETLSYVLDKPARVAVRLGLTEGGPLLRTLLDWVVRPAGFQQEQWDGKDASNVLDIANHAKLAISVQAFSLPENTIVVGAPQAKVQLIDSLPAEVKKRPVSATRPKRMYAHAQQPLEMRGDFKISLSLPEMLPRSPSGLPVVFKTIPVRLDVDVSDRERALARRFEPVFFIDGQFVFENEVGFIPMTWNFDPATLSEGEHYLTVNVRGYEGNFGIATVKIVVGR